MSIIDTVIAEILQFRSSAAVEPVQSNINDFVSMLQFINGNIGPIENPETANTFLAGPINGVPAIPTFRTIDGADIAAITDAATANFQWTNQGATTTSPGWYAQITGDAFARVRIGLNAQDIASVSFGSGALARDTFLERVSAANIRQGQADAAAPISQTWSTQNVLTGTANTAGADYILALSQSTGNAAGGGFRIKGSVAGVAGNVQNPLADLAVLLTTGLTLNIPLTATGTVNLSPANQNVTISPTGTGQVIINPATAGTIDNVSLGGTTRGAAKVTTLDASGASTVVALTASGQLIGGGTTTNNNAATGVIGEYLISNIASGSAIALTTATPADITSLSLTAGDWEIEGTVGFITANTASVTQTRQWVNSVSATEPTSGATQGVSRNTMSATVFGAATQFINPTGRRRISIAITTTVYLTTQATFTVAAMSAYGALQARRIR